MIEGWIFAKHFIVQITSYNNGKTEIFGHFRLKRPITAIFSDKICTFANYSLSLAKRITHLQNKRSA